MDEMVLKSRKPRTRTKAEPEASSDRSRVQWKGYVNPTLTAAEKRAYAGWKADNPSIDVKVAALTRQGYKISFDYVERERAYRASFYCQNASSSNAGYCLSLFAGDVWEALMRLVYLHEAVLGGDWNAHDAKGGWRDDWG